MREKGWRNQRSAFKRAMARSDSKAKKRKKPWSLQLRSDLQNTATRMAEKEANNRNFCGYVKFF